MNRARKFLDEIANYSIILSSTATLCFIAFFFYNARHSGHTSDQLSTIRVGDRIAYNALRLAPGKPNYIFALQVGCRFCTQSAPAIGAFLQATKSRSDVAMVAVFPEETGSEKAYLESLSLEIPFTSASFRSLGVAGTPTTILCDGRGYVKRIWRGALTAKDQDEIIKSLSL